MGKTELQVYTSKKSIKAKRCFSFTHQPQPHPHLSNRSVDGNLAKTSVSKRKRLLNGLNEVKLCSLRRAEQVQSSLDPKFPSLVKYMLPSHVSGGFWLGLPSNFCKSHLPKQDEMLTLVDENGEEYPTKYLVDKIGLSGGWRGFSIAHKLVEGDVLVFHLITATKFKVYIVRAYDLAEVDGALGLLGLDVRGKLTDPEANAIMCTTTTQTPAQKRQNSPPLSILERKNQSSPNLVVPTQKTENDSKEEAISEILNGIRFSESTVEFKDVKNLESFVIEVNGFIIDSEFSDYIRTKYYELCCSQKAFLHEHLLEGINFKLIAGIISETVNIADAIKASNLSTSQDEFAIWDKSLMAFEQMGMNVSFLRSRLQGLVSLAFESEEAKDLKRYREAIIEKARAEEEIRNMEVKLVDIKEETKMLEVEIESLKVKVDAHELKFQGEVSAP